MLGSWLQKYLGLRRLWELVLNAFFRCLISWIIFPWIGELSNIPECHSSFFGWGLIPRRDSERQLWCHQFLLCGSFSKYSWGQKLWYIPLKKVMKMKLVFLIGQYFHFSNLSQTLTVGSFKQDQKFRNFVLVNFWPWLYVTHLLEHNNLLFIVHSFQPTYLI